MPEEPPVQGLRYVLGLLDAADAGPVRERLGIAGDGPVGPTALHHEGRLIRDLLRDEGSVWIWILEEGDPRARAMLLASNLLPLGLRKDLERVGRSVRDLSGRELVYGLRRVEGRGRLRKARDLVAQLRGDDWPVVADAHADEPLPGIARWALAERIDCPQQLRADFGEHPKFRHRLRAVGIYDSPEEWMLTSPYRAADVLPLYGLGTWAFPGHLAEAERTLAPLVAASLGTDVDAWAELARVLHTFDGTLPALLTAVGGAARGPDSNRRTA